MYIFWYTLVAFEDCDFLDKVFSFEFLLYTDTRAHAIYLRLVIFLTKSTWKWKFLITFLEVLILSVIHLSMLKKMSIMPVLCSMFWLQHYAQKYAGIMYLPCFKGSRRYRLIFWKRNKITKLDWYTGMDTGFQLEW